MERTGPPDASLGVRSKDFRLLELDRVRMIGSLCFPYHGLCRVRLVGNKDRIYFITRLD